MTGMFSVGTVGQIKSGDIHASLYQLLNHGSRATSRTDSAHYLGSPFKKVGVFHITTSLCQSITYQ
jgi:hypothetical protein